jgi:hypothetical protein
MYYVISVPSYATVFEKNLWRMAFKKINIRVTLKSNHYTAKHDKRKKMSFVTISHSYLQALRR